MASIHIKGDTKRVGKQSNKQEKESKKERKKECNISPCSIRFASSQLRHSGVHSSMSTAWVDSLISAAENLPSFITPAMYLAGMIPGKDVSQGKKR